MTKAAPYHRARSLSGGFDELTEGPPPSVEEYEREGVAWTMLPGERMAQRIEVWSETVESFVARGGEVSATPPVVPGLNDGEMISSVSGGYRVDDPDATTPTREDLEDAADSVFVALDESTVDADMSNAKRSSDPVLDEDALLDALDETGE